MLEERATLFALHRDDIDTLFTRVKEGNRAAVEPAFEALWPVVRRYCLKLLGDESDADDATQSSLIKMFEQAPDYDPQRSAVAWALTFSYFECLTLRKTRARRQAREADPDALSRQASFADPERALSEAEVRRFANDLLAELQPADRALLGVDETSSYAAVQQALESLAPSLRRKRKQRVLDRLRRAFREIITPAASSIGDDGEI